MTVDDFLESKPLTLKDPMEGYAITYSYLKALLEEYAQVRVDSLGMDHTFATRLKSFVSDIQTNDPMSFEEREYIERVANKLLAAQNQNATEQWEKDYLERCHK